MFDKSTTKALLMALAPADIPGWYQAPPFPYTGAMQPDISQVTESDRPTVQEWLDDGIEDLPEHLTWFSDAWRKNVDDRREYRNNLTAHQVFSWKLYYAEQILHRI